MRRWFFIDLDLLSKDSDQDDIVIEKSKRDIEDLLSPAEQYKRHLLPCTVLLRAGDFYKWRDGFEDWVRTNQPDQESIFRGQWRQSWQKIVDGVQGFEVPLVELPRVSDDNADAMGRICAIFEKLNSTGVELSVYDLLTARLYRSKIALHKLWDEACENNPLLAAWSDGKADTNKFGVLVLRTLALLRDLDPKPKMLISLNPNGFENDWRRAARAMNRALEIATAIHDDGFGVFERDWMPNFGLLPVLAALRTVIEEKNLGESERSQVRRWYWISVFLERYSSSVESKSRSDYSGFQWHWFRNGPPPYVLYEARRIGSQEFTIRSATSNASGIYCGVFCLLAKRGARDWRRGEHIELQSLQDHHIFPKDYLKRHGVVSADQTNTVVNRTLIADHTNNKIRSKAPADYLNDTEIFSTAPKDLLSAHFVDALAIDALKLAKRDISDDAARSVYDQFLAAREQSIIMAIREVCGVPPTT